MADPQTPQTLAERSRLLEYQASLFDADTGLPSLPAVIGQVRRMLDLRDELAVLLIRPEHERDLETVIGWETYDRMLVAVARHLEAAIGGSDPRRVLVCQETVRCDTFLVFIADERRLSVLSPELVANPVAVEPDGDVGDRVRLRVGHGRVRRRMAQRLERCIYRGVLEARLDFHQRGEALDEVRRSELRGILDRGEIVTLFQPIVSLPDRSVVAYEALSRGPAGSYLEPAENLFGFTQRAGLLGEVERLCLDRALAAAVDLPVTASLFLNLSVSGLDAIETRNGGLGDRVRRVGWDASRFVLEITEHTAADDPRRLAETVTRLRRQGLRIAIDDVGAGYSSLHVLADLQPDFIKLDQMLVRDLSRAPIKRNLVSAIVGFAATSRSAVIAEGVETPEEARALHDLGVNLMQGFHFGLPEPV